MELAQLTRLAESAARMVQAEAAAVCLLDASGAHLGVAAAYGLPGDVLDGAPWPVQSCAFDREALAGVPVVITDIRDDSRAVGGLAPGQDVRAALGLPLLYGNKPLGTLHVYAAAPGRFSPDDAARLKPLAELGAAYIAAAQALAELKTLEANQAQFVRVVTHELRSPITVSQSLVRSVLKGYAGAMTDKQAEVFARVSRRLDFMESLVNDLLDLAAGKAPGAGEPEPVVLNASIGRVLLLLQPRAEDKNIKLTLQTCREPLVVRGTEPGLDRIFVNLVGNAVKYTPAGGAVTVSVQPIGGQAQVEVSDTGIGIPEEALPNLFQEFYRAPNAKQVAETGTGLGLAIVKDLVERYGGRIQVRSAVGHGTTFTVTFPLVSNDSSAALEATCIG